jgi:hypothetical protein
MVIVLDKHKLYEVEIKSLAIIREGQKSLITYFKGGNHAQIISDCKQLYPQYMNPDDKPNVNITPISYRAYKERVNTNLIKQKGVLVDVKGRPS